MQNLHEGIQPLSNADTDNPQMLVKWDKHSRLVPIERNQDQHFLQRECCLEKKRFINSDATMFEKLKKRKIESSLQDSLKS